MSKRLALNFRKLKDHDLYMLAMMVVHHLADNEYFPDAAPMLPPIRETVEQFNIAMSQAHRGDILKINIKNDYKEKLIPLLRDLGEWIEEKANGAETLLLSSGFPIAKARGEVELQSPAGFRILPGKNNGEIIMKMKRMIGAKAYLFQYAPDPLTDESQWQTIYGTQCKKTITNLPLGVKYLFRMAVIGARDQIVYTSILSRYIA